jgi:hypothetical protein
MNNICTWLCADQKGEESDFPQSGQKSSSQKHQDIYWRCLIVFFVTSRRFNTSENHLLFTNTKKLPVVDGLDISEILKELKVKVIYIPFDYKTPKGYFGSFQNQFFEFSILKYIANNDFKLKDQYLILDSDCIFIKPAKALFNAASKKGYISFEIDSPVHHKINGLSRLDMKELFSELLERDVDTIPSYHLGEFLLCNVEHIKKLNEDFAALWPVLLKRNLAGLKKLNEEAHTLSYLFYKNGLEAEEKNHFIKRIWTNPVFYRNVASSDLDLTVWHLPAEKTFGIARLFDCLVKSEVYNNIPTDAEFVDMTKSILGIPNLTANKRIHYYVVSYFKAFRKRLVKIAS